MQGDDGLDLDRVQLAARGWTRTLRERFLPNPDRRVTLLTTGSERATDAQLCLVERRHGAELTDFQL